MTIRITDPRLADYELPVGMYGQAAILTEYFSPYRNLAPDSAAQATAEVQALRQEISDFVHHPINTLLPGVLAPLLAEAVAGLKARRTEKTEGAEEAED